MDTFFILAGAGLAIFFLLVLRKGYFHFPRLQAMKSIVAGLLLLNGAAIAVLTLVLVVGTPISAQEPAPTGPEGQEAEVSRQGQQPADGGSSKEMAAALAVGLSTIAAGIAVAVTGSAAIGGMTQNPDIFGRSLVFVGLAEGIAIYGLIISFMILMGFGGGGGG